MRLLESELAPESILPVQFYDRAFGTARIQPERRLQVAVLADAILTFFRWAGNERRRARRLFGEVDAWFASDDVDSPFTFIGICDSLKLDPSFICKGLRQWRAQFETTDKQKVPLRRDGNGSRHRVVFPRLRRVA